MTPTQFKLIELMNKNLKEVGYSEYERELILADFVAHARRKARLYLLRHKVVSFVKDCYYAIRLTVRTKMFYK